MNKDIKNNAIVSRSNKLIGARYRLSLIEQRIIWALCSCIEPNDEDFKPYEFKVNNLAEICLLDENSAYAQIKKTTKTLLSKVLEIDEEDKLIQVAWLSSAVYMKKTGTVILKVSSDLKPYLLKLKEKFTQIKIEELMSFDSAYSGRLYEIIRSLYDERTISKAIDLEELKQMLGINKEKAYKQYGEISRRILKPAMKEISAKTDLIVSFEEIKTIRKVTAIKFKAENKNQKNATKSVSQNFNVEELSPEFKVRAKKMLRK